MPHSCYLANKKRAIRTLPFRNDDNDKMRKTGTCCVALSIGLRSRHRLDKRWLKIMKSLLTLSFWLRIAKCFTMIPADTSVWRAWGQCSWVFLRPTYSKVNTPGVLNGPPSLHSEKKNKLKIQAAFINKLQGARGWGGGSYICFGVK